MEGEMADTLKRSHVKRETAQARAYSQAVITEGGRTIWLAGQVAIEDSSGRSLAADFDGQVREVFARLGRTLEEAGASLADLVTMTVFITDARLGDRFTQLRREIFADNFPASALITVAGLARVHVRIWERPEVRVLRATRQHSPRPEHRQLGAKTGHRPLEGFSYDTSPGLLG